jgi:hypothetical protein
MSANWDALKERVPDSYIKQRKQGGNTLSYVAWYNACDLLDERAPGWACEIKQVGELDGKVFMRVAVTIDGVTRETIGYEDEDMKGYGDPFSNSFGMALRRAAALFGIARHLYDKDDKPQAPARYPAKVEHVQPAARARAPEPPATDGETRNWHEDIADLWKRLRALGHPDFKTPPAMLDHFKRYAKAKQWADRLQDIEKVTEMPLPTARVYTGILTDIYLAAKDGATK